MGRSAARRVTPSLQTPLLICLLAPFLWLSGQGKAWCMGMVTVPGHHTENENDCPGPTADRSDYNSGPVRRGSAELDSSRRAERHTYSRAPRHSRVGRAQELRVVLACHHVDVLWRTTADYVDRRSDLCCSYGGTAWATSIVGGFQATSKGSGNHSWNGHVPVAIWARPTCPPRWETDMHHGRRSTRSGPELQLPSRKQWHLGQGRDAHAGHGGPQGQEQVPHEPSSMAPIGRQRPSVTRYPSMYLGWFARGWEVYLGGIWAAVVDGVVSRHAAVTVWA